MNRRPFLAAMIALLSLLATAQPGNAQFIRALSGTEGTILSNSLPYTDSLRQVPLHFTINYYGTQSSSLWVSVHGFAALGDLGGLPETPLLLTSGSIPLLAPFFAELNDSDSYANYGAVSVPGYASAYAITWHHFPGNSSAQDLYQLVLLHTGGTAGRGSGDFDFEFNYQTVNTDTSGGDVARAGWSSGTGIVYELLGSGSQGAMLDSSSYGLIHGSLNSSGTAGRYVFQVVNGDPPEMSFMGDGGSLDIRAGTVVLTGSYNTLNALSLSGSGQVVLAEQYPCMTLDVINRLSITGSSARLDLTNNALVVRASGTGQQAANLLAVQARVKLGYNGGWWNGPGITSSTAAADAQINGLLSVMVYDNTQLGLESFEGASGLDSGGFNQVLLKTTFTGDFDASAFVDTQDYGLEDYYGSSSNPTLGDLNWDGVVNGLDYALLDYVASNQASLNAETPMLVVTPATNNQKAVPGMQLPAPLQVTVMHFVKGRIVPWPGAAVTFSAPAGSWVTFGTANDGGSVTAFANGNGVASIGYTLPETSGTFTVTASAGVAPHQVSVAITAIAYDFATWLGLYYTHTSGMTEDTPSPGDNGTGSKGWTLGEDYRFGTNPNKDDTDNDGIPDPQDPYPLDPKRSRDVPVTQLAALDISGTASDGQDVTMVALGDDNTAAFAYYKVVGSGTTCIVKQWVNGSVATVQEFPLQRTDTLSYDPNHTVTRNFTPGALLPDGTVYGEWSADASSETHLLGSGSFMAPVNSGSPVILPESPNNLDDGFYVDNFYSLNGVTTNGYCGWADVILSNQGDGSYGFVFSAGSYTEFNPNAPSNAPGNVIKKDFFPKAINTNGWAVGYGFLDGNKVWDGNDVTPNFAPGSSVAINDQNEIISLDYEKDGQGHWKTDSNGHYIPHGYLWQGTSGSSGTSKDIQELLPPAYQNQIKNIAPKLLSNENPANHNAYSIKFTADTLEGSGSGSWVNRTFILTTGSDAAVSGSNAKLNVQQLPEGVTITSGDPMNFCPLVADIGTITTTGSAGTPNTSGNDALIHPPVGINVVSYLNKTPGKPIISGSSVCVGEPVTLSVTGTSYVSTYHWRVDGAIKGYDPTKDSGSGQVLQLSATDTSASSITLYYPVVLKSGTSTAITTSGTAVVSCDLTLKIGGTCTISGSLNVVAPKVMVTGTQVGAVEAYFTLISGTSNLKNWGIYDGHDDTPYGMVFQSSTLSPPSGFTSGSANWNQVINQDSVNKTVGGSYQSVNNVLKASDGHFPYHAAPTSGTDDSPYIKDYFHPPVDEFDRTFYASMYYMWKPGVNNGIWVPLAVLNWSFKGVANWQSSTNQFLLDASSYPTSVPVPVSPTAPTEEPTWDSVYPP